MLPVLPFLDSPALATLVGDPSHSVAATQSHTTTLYPDVYHNALTDPDSVVADSSPHTWTHSEPCDITPDEPYASWAHSGDNTTSLGYIGGVGINGGQGNADCIYGSCSDHNTFGVSGVGWQGPGNGEQPGDLWNPADGSAPESAGTSKLGFIGGAGIEGGQGNADSIYGSHDDHSTYGVLGSGWQGPGNGEAPGDLWNPAVATHEGAGMPISHALAAPVVFPRAADAPKLGPLPEHVPECGGEDGGRKTVRSSPGHMMVMGHAMLYGALAATTEMACSAAQMQMQGRDVSISWSSKFRETATEACESVSPVGAYMLKAHVLKP